MQTLNSREKVSKVLVADERVAVSIELGMIGLGGGEGVGSRLKRAKKRKKVGHHQFYCRQ